MGRALKRETPPLAGAELPHQHFGGALGVHLAARNQHAALGTDGLQKIVRRQVQRAFVQLVAGQKLLRVDAPHAGKQAAGELLDIEDIVADGADKGKVRCRFQRVKLFPQHAGHVHQVEVIDRDPLLAAGDAGLVGGFGAGGARKRVDESRLAHVGDADNHYANRRAHHAAVAAAGHQGRKLFLDGAFGSGGTAALLGVHRKAASPGTFEIGQPLLGDLGVGQIRFIEDVQVGLARRDALDLGVQAGKRDARIENLQNAVHIADLFFHQAQGLGHVTGEPLDLTAVDDVTLAHCTAPILLKGRMRHRAVPRMSRVSTQPISVLRLSLDPLRLSPIRNRQLSGTVRGKSIPS